MSAILKLILQAFAGTFFDALADAFKDWNNGRVREDLGAAKQRETDMRADNERVAEAAAARDDIAAGGGVRIEDDPWNRANRKQ